MWYREPHDLFYTICKLAGVGNGNGYFEILNCSGTVFLNGSHLHLSIADSEGKTIGGHLMYGCKIYTTAEIVIVESADYIFKRVKDLQTRFKDLRVERKNV